MLIMPTDAGSWINPIEKRDFALGWLGNRYARGIYAGALTVVFAVFAGVLMTLFFLLGNQTVEDDHSGVWFGTLMTASAIFCVYFVFFFKNRLKARDAERWRRSFLDSEEGIPVNASSSI